MKKSFISKFLFVILFFSCQTFAKSIEKSISVYIIEEKVDEKRFMHRSDLIDGKAHDLWAIDGQNVAYQEYEKALIDAEVSEVRKMRQQAEEHRKREQKFKMQAHYDIIKKIVHNYIVDINKELTRLDNILIAHFLQFDQDSIHSRDALGAIEREVEQAYALLQRSDIHDIHDLKEIMKTLEEYPRKLVKLYQNSVNHAIKTCDNTKDLKELLALVS